MRMSAFLATTLLGEVGERRNEPKAERKIVLRSRVLSNNCLEGPFHTVPVLLSSIAAFATVDLQIRLHRISYRFAIVDCALQWFRS